MAFYDTTLFQEHFVAVAVSDERAAPNPTLESNSVLLRRRRSKSNTQYQRRGKIDVGCRARAIHANSIVSHRKLGRSVIFGREVYDAYARRWCRCGVGTERLR
jgi:hypothetical protein